MSNEVNMDITLKHATISGVYIYLHTYSVVAERFLRSARYKIVDWIPSDIVKQNKIPFSKTNNNLFLNIDGGYNFTINKNNSVTLVIE